MAKINFSDLELAFDFVSAGAPMEHNAYVSLDTGQIYWVSDLVDDMEEEIPEDLETSDRYVLVPHKNDLDLGRRLVTRFVREAMRQDVAQVENIFSRRGAYARFKNFLESKGQLENWYQFEETARSEALRAWCAEIGLEITDERHNQSTPATSVKSKIRPVVASDAAAICTIYNPYVLETVITFEQAPVSEAQMAQRIREYTALYPWLVAEVDAKVVAYAYATRWRTRAAYDHTLESTVYVDKAFAGRGIAKPLYIELLRELKTRGVHAVVGCIALPNDASIAVHEKCGFVKVAHFPETGRKFERWVDVGFWQITFPSN